MTGILWVAVASLFGVWLLGTAINVGWWINFLLFFAIIAFILNLITSAIKGY